MKYGVARNISATLKANGVDHLFLLTGGDQPLFIALKEAGIRLVLARSEASAVYMADAYARVTGKPGLVYGQWGPGAANVAAALAEPCWARSPVVALTSAIGTSVVNRNEYQEIDQLSMYGPVTKWNKSLGRTDRASELVRMALQVATSGCPGPVHLDLPRDILEAECDLEDPQVFGSPSLPSPDKGAISRAIELFTKADRPIVLAGAGAVLSNAANELARLMDEFHVPVATSMGGKGIVSDDHPLTVGVVGRYSRTVANAVLKESDCVLVVGSRLGGMVTNGNALPEPNARVIQIDIDAEVIGLTRKRKVDIGIQADCRLALQAFCEELATKQQNLRYSAWTTSVQQRILGWKQSFKQESQLAAVSGPLGPAAVIAALNEIVRDDDIVVADTGYMGAWAGALLNLRKPGRHFLRAAGSLGWAFPAALGAQLAAPDARVICVIGDGGFGYHVGDIETALRCKIPVIVIVLNNGGLAFEYQMQKYHYDTIVPEVNDFYPTDYSAIATAYGAEGARVATYDDLRTYLRRAYSSRSPYVLDVLVDRESYPPVTSYDKVRNRIL